MAATVRAPGVLIELPFSFFPAITKEMVAFAVRNWAASMLALYIAFALQLESPVWAWLTVWIAAQPSPGQVLSKGLYRIAGTIAGAAFAVLIMANFAQTPELFVVALAALVGGCTVLSNILTNFRAYATVLAGYTAGIVASDSINSPDQVFTIALARGAAICVAIASSIVVTSIFAPHRAESFTRSKLAELLEAAARRAAIPWQTPIEEKLKIGRKLIDDAIALDTLIEFAAAESGIFRLQANNARSLVGHVLGIVSARRSLDAHLHRVGWPSHEALQIFHGVGIDLLNDVPHNLERHRVDEQIDTIEEVRQQLAKLDPERDTADGEDAAAARYVIDRSDDLLDELRRALINWRDILDERWERKPTRSLNFHRDVRAAWINGLRAFIAVCLVGGFWIASAWNYGPSALIFVSVVISLFSSFPHPGAVSWVFLLGSLPGVVLGPPLKYIVFAAGSGFDYLLIVTFIAVIPMGLLLANPKTTFPTTAFMFVYLNLAGPANPMVYDLSDTFNSGIAIVIGTFIGALCFSVVLPADPHAARAYVTYRIRRGLGMMASMVPIPQFSDWETRMYDRVNRLRDPNNPSGTHTDEWFEAGLSALTLGNEILRLRHYIKEETMPDGVRAAAQSAIDGLARILCEPEPAYAALRDARVRVAPLDPGQGSPQRAGWARVMAAMEEMDVYLTGHPRLLKRAPIP